MSDESSDSYFGALSVVGALSLCCIGLGAVAGGAVLAGGAAGTTTVAVGSSTLRGALVSLGVTLVTVVVIAAVANRRLR